MLGQSWATHLSYWSKKDMQLHLCNYIDATKNVFDGINKHMSVRIAHFFTCDNQAFSYTSHFLFFCIVSFFLNEWVGSDELRNKKCHQQQQTTTYHRHWSSDDLVINTMLQYSRNAINVNMFFIVIAILSIDMEIGFIELIAAFHFQNRNEKSILIILTSFEAIFAWQDILFML